MRALRACAALLALAACNEDKPLPPVGAWVLQSGPSITLEVDAEFNFYGQGPCNRYFGRFEVVETGLSASPIGATLMACPNLDQEFACFSALEATRSTAMEDGQLVLRSAEGAALVFSPQP
ncbi:META domain-containing protein [Rhodobacterales bacterium HKCCA1065]|nr:META domain-containing protein [Rhodobacterales bacterium HKCCA1065]